MVTGTMRLVLRAVKSEVANDWEQETENKELKSAAYCLLVLHAANESHREAMSFPTVSQAVRSTSKQ